MKFPIAGAIVVNVGLTIIHKFAWHSKENCNNFAQFCRKPEEQPQTWQTNVNQIDGTDEKHDKKQLTTLITTASWYNQKFNSSYESSNDEKVAMVTSKSATKMERLKVRLTYGKVKKKATIESEMVCRKISKSSAEEILKVIPAS